MCFCKGNSYESLDMWKLGVGFKHQLVPHYTTLAVLKISLVQIPLASKYLDQMIKIAIISLIIGVTAIPQWWWMEFCWELEPLPRSACSLFWSDLECCRCGCWPRSSCMSLASCCFESKPCYWLTAPGRTARVPPLNFAFAMAMFNQQVGLQGPCWKFLWACRPFLCNVTIVQAVTWEACWKMAASTSPV